MRNKITNILESDKYDVIIGELLLIIIILPVAISLNMLYPVIVAGLVIFGGKSLYHKDSRTHLHLCRTLCWPLTFGMLIVTGIVTWYLHYIAPFDTNQPLIPVLVAVGLGLYIICLGDEVSQPVVALEDELEDERKINAEILHARNMVINNLENENKSIMEEKYRLETKINTPFKCANASPDQIRAKGYEKGLKDDQIEFLIKAHRQREYKNILADEYHISTEAVKKRKQKWTKILES